MATILASTTQITATTLRPTAAAPQSRRGSTLPTPVIGLRFEGRRLRLVARSSSPTTPPEISDKVKESIKNAEETCAGDPESGECAAAWDEVEELSAAASHKRDQLKSTDPLEEFCKDNPETEYCRTYDD